MPGLEQTPGPCQPRSLLWLSADLDSHALLRKHPRLIEAYIRHCLTTTTAELYIFIADGAVVTEALMSTGAPSPRARRIVAAVSKELRAKVDAAVALLSEPRIKGVVHWGALDPDGLFGSAWAELSAVMTAGFAKGPGLAASVAPAAHQVQRHVKTLIRGLLKQRANVCATSCRPPTVFTSGGLTLARGERLLKRFVSCRCGLRASFSPVPPP